MPDNSQIIVDEAVTMPWPSHTHWDAKVYAWQDAGNNITAYNQYSTLTDGELRLHKYTLNATLADVQIQTAEHEPSAGNVLDDRNADKENTRRSNRGKRNAGMTDADDAMADYVDEIMDTLDTADDTVESLIRSELEAWDGSSIIWPTWTPPPEI